MLKRSNHSQKITKTQTLNLRPKLRLGRKVREALLRVLIFCFCVASQGFALEKTSVSNESLDVIFWEGDTARSKIIDDQGDPYFIKMKK